MIYRIFRYLFITQSLAIYNIESYLKNRLYDMISSFKYEMSEWKNTCLSLETDSDFS